MGKNCTNRGSDPSRYSVWLTQDDSIKTYEIRRPSRSKAQFLLHLGDWHRKALRDLIAARQFLLEVTKSFTERSGSTPNDDVQPKLAGKVLVDLDYLIETLRPVNNEIEQLQRSVSSSEIGRKGSRQSLMVIH